VLNELAQEIHQNSVDKGFYEKDRNPYEIWMLINTEIVEAVEAYRDGFGLNEFAYDRRAEGAFEDKPVGIPSEMADIFIRGLDACAYWGIDIEKAIKEKMAYNAKRAYKHGRQH